MNTSITKRLAFWMILLCSCTTSKGAADYDGVLGFISACEVGREDQTQFKTGSVVALYYPVGREPESRLLIINGEEIAELAWYHYPLADQDEVLEAQSITANERANAAFNFLVEKPYKYFRDYDLSEIIEQQLIECDF